MTEERPGWEMCAMPVGVLANGPPCGRIAGHAGPCVDDRIIARRGYCERHDVVGLCPWCDSEMAGRAASE